MVKKFVVLLYGIFLSSIIAGISYLFIMAEKTSSHWLWHSDFSHSTLYQAVLILVGSIALYALKRNWGSLPFTSHQVLHVLQEKGTLKYGQAWKSLLVALLILCLGAGVGPEAPLLGAVIAYSIWQADKMRYLYVHWEELSAGKRFAVLFHPRRYLQSYQVDQAVLEGQKKKLLVSLYAFNGLFVFWLLMRLSDQPSFVTTIGKSAWGLEELLYFLPLLASGFLFALIYQQVKKGVGRLKLGDKLSLPRKIAMGGLSIFVTSQVAPDLLFSGQHSMHTLFDMGLEASAIVLSLLAIGKLLLLDINLWAGWTGGDIFPLTFASLLQGFAMAKLLETQGLDTPFVVLVVGIAMAMQLMENRILALIFVSLFFPVNLWPVSLLVFVVYELMARFHKKNQHS
ncbi:chloride transporter [Streptococcus sp. 121]|uniref:chloride channel protein n=1 Tax=Streptococcus sp. 121 TaxID=2797637 RepID=UPI0018F09550|nr:chloride channel protein [Streptococcus sp. 121]MBJ6745227.1 chloride transporter [Streptococcus sp. 121]